MRKKLVRENVATLVENRPRIAPSGDVLTNVWTAEDAKAFIAYVKANEKTQNAALFCLAVDSGARIGELLGLQWKDLQGKTLRIERQLYKGGEEPVFSLPKVGRVRQPMDLSDETVTLLQQHKRDQSELKMKNRTVYKEHGLIFAQTYESGGRLGWPLNRDSVGKALTRACKGANVKEISPHGLRHTCATLLLSAGVPPHVVQRRLGHAKIEMTLNIYSHVLPSMQQDAAARLAALLH